MRPHVEQLRSRLANNVIVHVNSLPTCADRSQPARKDSLNIEIPTTAVAWGDHVDRAVRKDDRQRRRTTRRTMPDLSETPIIRVSPQDALR